MLLGRDPTLVEAVIWGIQGSEHCSYKSSKRFLRTFPTTGRHVILGPKEDSGIVAITDGPPGKRWGIVVSHESHNHPSQIVPYEGAATGVGGNVRDVACMGARVIGALDALRFGDLQSEESRTIAREAIRGIAGYGNPLGIPNLHGDVQFDRAYNANCLVNVVCYGIVREDEIIHSFVPPEAGEAGYDIIIVGKPTDRSGFGGASFASVTLEEEAREKNTGAVQEPNPFLERHLLAATYALFDWLAAEEHLGKVSFKDLGAGGVVCSTVEQVAAARLGADIDLEKVHVALSDLPPAIIACAETQERFCWICHPKLTEHMLTHYNEIWDLPSIAENARASVIGKVTKEPIYRLRFHGDVVCEAKAADITCGFEYERPLKPRATRDGKAKGEEETSLEPAWGNRRQKRRSIKEIFLHMLSHPNHASQAPIFRHYDKNIIGNTILERGDAAAGVIAPLQNLRSYVHEGLHPGWDELPDDERFAGVAVSSSGNVRYGNISPYWQGANAAVEAMRKVAAVGASPRALTDCLNYGNPEIPEQLWELAEGVRGIADASKGIRVHGEPVPVISGNVSLYNSTVTEAIPPSAIVSCIGVMPDARRAVSGEIKRSSSLLFLLGERRNEYGGSAYADVFGECGENIPQPDFPTVEREIAFIVRAAQAGLLQSCRDIGDAGLLLALFTMVVPRRRGKPTLGLTVHRGAFDASLPLEQVLFSGTGGFVMEVAQGDVAALRSLAAECRVALSPIGETRNDALFAMDDVFSEEVSALISIWEKPLQDILGL